jgi:hypothetical protein
MELWYICQGSFLYFKIYRVEITIEIEILDKQNHRIKINKAKVD